MYVSASLWKCIASCFMLNSTPVSEHKVAYCTVGYVHAIAMYSHFKTIKAKHSMAEVIIIHHDLKCTLCYIIQYAGALITIYVYKYMIVDLTTLLIAFTITVQPSQL